MSSMKFSGSAAASILRRAVELDNARRYTEALVCYQEGLQILVNGMKDEADPEMREMLRPKVVKYMERAEKIKKEIGEQKDKGLFHEQILIENNSTGHSYRSLFGRFLDDDVDSVAVEDPYVRSFHQCHNFLRLCELLVRTCPNLRFVSLLTARDARPGDQDEWLASVAEDLKKYRVNLVIEYSDTLHDRKIMMNTGWIIKLGRGLDIYKAPESKFSLGVHDMDLRPCYETTVDIIHSSNMKLSYG